MRITRYRFKVLKIIAESGGRISKMELYRRVGNWTVASKYLKEFTLLGIVTEKRQRGKTIIELTETGKKFLEEVLRELEKLVV